MGDINFNIISEIFAFQLDHLKPGKIGKRCKAFVSLAKQGSSDSILTD
jgi:hypothetical protein